MSRSIKRSLTGMRLLAWIWVVEFDAGAVFVSDRLTPRWTGQSISMAFILYIVHELLMGLSGSPELEINEGVEDKIKTARMLTVISWCNYSFMYLFLMSCISASKPRSASRRATTPPRATQHALLRLGNNGGVVRKCLDQSRCFHLVDDVSTGRQQVISHVC